MTPQKNSFGHNTRPSFEPNAHGVTPSGGNRPGGSDGVPVTGKGGAPDARLRAAAAKYLQRNPTSTPEQIANALFREYKRPGETTMAFIVRIRALCESEGWCANGGMAELTDEQRHHRRVADEMTGGAYEKAKAHAGVREMGRSFLSASTPLALDVPSAALSLAECAVNNAVRMALAPGRREYVVASQRGEVGRDRPRPAAALGTELTASGHAAVMKEVLARKSRYRD
jgi:hypothetical protein